MHATKLTGVAIRNALILRNNVQKEFSSITRHLSFAANLTGEPLARRGRDRRHDAPAQAHFELTAVATIPAPVQVATQRPQRPDRCRCHCCETHNRSIRFFIQNLDSTPARRHIACRGTHKALAWSSGNLQLKPFFMRRAGLAAISKAALRQPGTILGREGVRGAGRIYAYDNGPGHTIGFEPNTFVNVSPEWPAAMEWLGRLMAFVRQRPYDEKTLEGAQTVKEILARYRGLTCGDKYAEAVWAARAYPSDIL